MHFSLLGSPQILICGGEFGGIGRPSI
jgi:hypothetical protein